MNNLNKAVESRNRVLAAMGLESETILISSESIEINEKPYGEIVSTEIEKDVFVITYEKQDKFLSDLKSKPVGFFFGE